MSEENFLTSLVKSINVPTDLTKAALEPTAKQIGEGLGSLFYIAFSPIEKAKIKKEHEIKVFKENIEREISKIPVDQIQEPPLNVVGPALEASRYYIEDEELRNMFAKLIATSMNSNESNKAHASFIEIIKQLSPLDANVFKLLVQGEHIGVGKLRELKAGSSGGHALIRHFFPFPEMDINNFLDFEASIDNLIRLGLIDISFNASYVDKTIYEALKTHALYNYYLDKTKSNFTDLNLKEGIWEITTFGENFSKCCL